MAPPVRLKQNAVAVSTREVGGGSAAAVLQGGAIVYTPLTALGNEPRHMTSEANQRVTFAFLGPLALRVGGSAGSTFTREGGSVQHGQEVTLQLQLPSRNADTHSDLHSGKVSIKGFKGFTTAYEPVLDFNGMLRRNGDNTLSFDVDARVFSLLRFRGTTHDAPQRSGGKGGDFLAVSAPKVAYRVSLADIGARAERDAAGLGGHAYAGEVDWLKVSVGGQLTGGKAPLWLQLDFDVGTGFGHFQAIGEPRGENATGSIYQKVDSRLSLTGAIGAYTIEGFAEAGAEGIGMAEDPQSAARRAFRTQVGGGMEVGRYVGRAHVAIGGSYVRNTARANDVKADNGQIRAHAALHF